MNSHNEDDKIATHWHWNWLALKVKTFCLKSLNQSKRRIYVWEVEQREPLGSWCRWFPCWQPKMNRHFDRHLEKINLIQIIILRTLFQFLKPFTRLKPRLDITHGTSICYTYYYKIHPDYSFIDILTTLFT